MKTEKKTFKKGNGEAFISHYKNNEENIVCLLPLYYPTTANGGSNIFFGGHIVGPLIPVYKEHSIAVDIAPSARPRYRHVPPPGSSHPYTRTNEWSMLSFSLFQTRLYEEGHRHNLFN